MSYGILLSTEAQKDLAALPIEVRRYALRRLQALGDNPTALSRRSYFPYREACQLYQFDYDLGTQRYELCVLFQYGQDEQTIQVLAIGRVVRDLSQGLDP